MVRDSGLIQNTINVRESDSSGTLSVSGGRERIWVVLFHHWVFPTRLNVVGCSKMYYKMSYYISNETNCQWAIL